MDKWIVSLKIAFNLRLKITDITEIDFKFVWTWATSCSNVSKFFLHWRHSHRLSFFDFIFRFLLCFVFKWSFNTFLVLHSKSQNSHRYKVIHSCLSFTCFYSSLQEVAAKSHLSHLYFFISSVVLCFSSMWSLSSFLVSKMDSHLLQFFWEHFLLTSQFYVFLSDGS